MRKNISISLILIIVIILSGCAGTGKSTFQKPWAERILNKLTLREKIAQMMVYHMNMRFLNEENPKWKEITSLLQTDGIGGIHIWFGDAGTSLTLLNEIQRRSKLPILVDADIENGVNRRFPEGTDLPPLMAIAATGSSHFAYEAGKIAALESRALGIHWNFSPVTDVNNNPNNPIINTRSFGEDPDVVGEYAVQFMKGLQDNGMLATAKHFPGHGDTETDSHTSLATIPSDSTRLWSLELKPFQTVIDAGIDAVMVAHVHAPDLQPNANLPATLSPFWVTGVLRDKMGFKGVIVTDSMTMGGVTRNYSDPMH
jgi:beta-N-acetylhexosaminidase